MTARPMSIEDEIRVRVESSNPLVVISAIREALRRAGADRDEIARFSDQAFTSRDLADLRQVCRSWAVVEAPCWTSSDA